MLFELERNENCGLRGKSHIDFWTQYENEGVSLMTFWKFMYCNLLFLYLFNNRWKKDHLSIKKVGNYKINQRLKLWASVPIAVSSSPAAAYMYRWTLWTVYFSLVCSSRKNTGVNTKKTRNIQYSLFFTVCLNVTFCW